MEETSLRFDSVKVMSFAPYFSVQPLFVAIAFSASVSLARLVGPIVRVLVVVTVARLFKIVTKSLSSNWVEDEMSKSALMPVIRIDFSEEQFLNMPFRLYTFDAFNAGITVNFEQYSNILAMLVAFGVSI